MKTFYGSTAPNSTDVVHIITDISNLIGNDLGGETYVFIDLEMTLSFAISAVVSKKCQCTSQGHYHRPDSSGSDQLYLPRVIIGQMVSMATLPKKVLALACGEVSHVLCRQFLLIFECSLPFTSTRA